MTSLDVQRELLAVLPEVVNDAFHAQIAEKLKLVPPLLLCEPFKLTLTDFILEKCWRQALTWRLRSWTPCQHSPSTRATWRKCAKLSCELCRRLRYAIFLRSSASFFSRRRLPRKLSRFVVLLSMLSRFPFFNEKKNDFFCVSRSLQMSDWILMLIHFRLTTTPTPTMSVFRISHPITITFWLEVIS